MIYELTTSTSDFNFVSENIIVVPASPSVPTNEDKLEIVSISDDEENGSLVKLNSSETSETCKLPSSKQQQQQKVETTPYSIMDAAIKTTDTSFVLEPVREEQPRPNKLSRSRAPLNQSKAKDSKILLMSLDASPMNNEYSSNSNTNNIHSSNNNNGSEMMSQRAFEHGAGASALLSSIPLSFSHSQNSSNGYGGNSSSNNNYNSKNDGNLLPLNRLDSVMRSTQDTSSTTRSASTMPTQQSAVTSFANNVNSIEPELVLSPAKLGQ